MSVDPAQQIWLIIALHCKGHYVLCLGLSHVLIVLCTAIHTYDPVRHSSPSFPSLPHGGLQLAEASEL